MTEQEQFVVPVQSSLLNELAKFYLPKEQAQFFDSLLLEYQPEQLLEIFIAMHDGLQMEDIQNYYISSYSAKELKRSRINDYHLGRTSQIYERFNSKVLRDEDLMKKLQADMSRIVEQLKTEIVNQTAWQNMILQEMNAKNASIDLLEKQNAELMERMTTAVNHHSEKNSHRSNGIFKKKSIAAMTVIEKNMAAGKYNAEQIEEITSALKENLSDEQLLTISKESNDAATIKQMVRLYTLRNRQKNLARPEQMSKQENNPLTQISPVHGEQTDVPEPDEIGVYDEPDDYDESDEG